MYEVGEKEIARLDAFEGHPDFYTRQEIEVVPIDGTVYHPHPTRHYHHLMIKTRLKTNVVRMIEIITAIVPHTFKIWTSI